MPALLLFVEVRLMSYPCQWSIFVDAGHQYLVSVKYYSINDVSINYILYRSICILRPKNTKISTVSTL